MIDSLYKTVLTILNKNQRGKISPSEFNNICHEAIKAVYVELFTDFKKSNFKKSRLQETPNYGSESFNLKQALEHWVEEKEFIIDSTGKVILGKDVFTVNSIFGSDSEYYKVDMLNFNRLTRSGRMKPTECSPIYAMLDSKVKVAPLPSNNKIDITYFRVAKKPKWTFNIVGNTELFNSSAQDYQDLDIHPMLLHRLFVEVLNYAGLNLREQEIAQAVSQMKQIEIANEQ